MTRADKGSKQPLWGVGVSVRGFKTLSPYPERHCQALGEAGRLWGRPVRGGQMRQEQGAWTWLTGREGNTHGDQRTHSKGAGA